VLKVNSPYLDLFNKIKEKKENFTVIDCHVHIGYPPDADKKFKWLISARPLLHFSFEECLNEMNRWLIAKTVVFPLGSLNDRYQGISYENANLMIIEMSKQFNEKIGETALIPFARIDPADKEKAITLLKRMVKIGARGIKIHSGNEGIAPDGYTVKIKENGNKHAVAPQKIPEYKEIYRQIFETCVSLDIPVVLHAGESSVELIGRAVSVLRNVPEVKLIIAHAGSGDETASNIANKFQNVYVDISGLNTIKIAHVIARTKVEKVLFGSDAPFITQGSSIINLLEALSMQNYTDAENIEILERILHSNSEQLISDFHTH